MIYNLDTMEDCEFKRIMLKVIGKAVEKEETEPKSVYDTMIRLVRTARGCLKADEAMRGLGQDNSVFFGIYGDVADAIYYLINEQTETFDISVTWKTITDSSLSNEQCTRRLMKEYNRNHSEVMKLEDLLK